MKLGRSSNALTFLILMVSGPASAQVTTAIESAIRTQAYEHSEIQATVHTLADVIGPRLTGTQSQKEATRWAVYKLSSYGLANAHLESWNFGHAGWVNIQASGAITSPISAPVTFAPAAWTSGTHGRINGQAVLITPPEAPSRSELDSFLASIASVVRDRIVLVGSVGPEELSTQPALWRLDDRTLAQILDPAKSSDIDPDVPGVLQPQDVDIAIDGALRRYGAILRINPSHMAGGRIAAGRNRRFEPKLQLPTVTMSDGDYARITALMADDHPIRLTFDVLNRTQENRGKSYNVFAEIPGTDPAAGVVMFGAHLDSWHVASGANDDAVGCAIMMEAARILIALHVKPHRTLRIVLWSGEEQGLLGSQDYVARHFGTAELPKPSFSNLAAYVNIDGGTGKVRAANVFGPPAAAEMLGRALAPTADLGVVGVVPHHVRRLGATDATTFSRAGLPAIGLIQDPLDYPATHHSNIDTANHLQLDDAKQAAIVVATLLYQLATATNPVPRFTRAGMPAPMGLPPSPPLH